jgi:hypothetical protein
MARKELHAFRVEDELWDEVKRLAERDGGLAEVLRQAMRRYRDASVQEGRDQAQEGSLDIESISVVD